MSHVGLQSEEQRRLTIEAKLARAEAYLDADHYAKAAMEAEAVLKIDKNNPKAKRILDAARKAVRKRAIELRKRAVAGTKRAPSKEKIVSRMVTRAERFLEMEEENKLIFQRILGKGTPAPISDDGTAAFDDKAEPNPHSPTPPFPLPLIPND